MIQATPEAVTPALRLQGVGRRFGALQAVRDVDLEIPQGQRRAILGPNGAGKTTLFNVVTGDYPPTSGSVFLFGEDVTRMPAQLRTRRGLGRTYQTVLLFGGLSVADNLYLAANVIGFDTSPFLSYIFLDRGSNDNIRRDMPVVTEAGLVGRVVEVTATACKVLLITDPNPPVNARVVRSRAAGVVVGQTAGSLTLQYLAQEAEVQPGDVVITSGLGGKYPEGIVIGTVTVVQRQDYEVQQTAVLVSPIDFRALEMALIITSFQPIDFEPFSQPTPAP